MKTRRIVFMKKKLLCFLGAAALALALSACSSNKSTSEAASEGASDVAQSSAGRYGC